jgi:hypothetical protein
VCVEKKGRSLVSSFILFPRLRGPTRPDDIAYVIRRTPGFFFFFFWSFVRERVSSFGPTIQAVFIYTQSQ